MKKNLKNQRKLRKESSYFLVSALISWPQPDSNRKEMNDLDWIEVFRKCQYKGQDCLILFSLLELLCEVGKGIAAHQAPITVLGNFYTRTTRQM